MSITNEDKRAFEDVLSQVFGRASGGGDEELLRTAIEFGRQFSGAQVAKILYLQSFILKHKKDDKDKTFQIIDGALKKYFSLQQYHNSAEFVGRLFSDLSAKRFFGQDAGKINVMRQLGV